MLKVEEDVQDVQRLEIMEKVLSTRIIAETIGGYLRAAEAVSM